MHVQIMYISIYKKKIYIYIYTYLCVCVCMADIIWPSDLRCQKAIDINLHIGYNDSTNALCHEVGSATAERTPTGTCHLS